MVVVDDASSDSTAAIAKKSGAIVITHHKNRGLGGALRTGFERAIQLGADTVITIDADGQHDPRDIKKFIDEIDKGYEFVLGKRDLRRYPFIKKFGNFFLNFATNFISGTKLEDTESGFRAIKTSALKRMYLRAEKYEIAVEIIFEVGRNELKYTNVPIDSPIYVKGVSVRDGIKNFSYLLRRRKRNWREYISDFFYVIRKQRISS